MKCSISPAYPWKFSSQCPAAAGMRESRFLSDKHIQYKIYDIMAINQAKYTTGPWPEIIPVVISKYSSTENWWLTPNTSLWRRVKKRSMTTYIIIVTSSHSSPSCPASRSQIFGSLSCSRVSGFSNKTKQVPRSNVNRAITAFIFFPQFLPGSRREKDNRP